MEIFVKSMHGYETIILKVNSSDSIKTVKDMIRDKGKYPVTMLVFENNELEDTALLSELNIRDACVLYSNQIRRAAFFHSDDTLADALTENAHLKEENASLKSELAKRIDLHELQLQIFVYSDVNHDRTTLMVKPSYTIKKVKQMFRAIERFPVTSLSFAGEDLPDDALLSDYKIEEGSTLHASVLLKAD